jgi:hypothetical protein
MRHSMFDILLIGGALLLWLAYYIFHVPVSFCFAAGLLYAISIEGYKLHTIKTRKFDSLHHLPYAPSRVDYFLSGAMLIIVCCLLLFEKPNGIYSFLFALSLVAVGAPHIMRLRLRAPRYILTADHLIENDHNLTRRKLEDLHSICLGWTSDHIKVRFVNQYDIVLSRNRYSDQELAAFIQKIINLAPVEGDIDPHVQKFLDECATSDNTIQSQ